MDKRHPEEKGSGLRDYAKLNQYALAREIQAHTPQEIFKICPPELEPRKLCSCKGHGQPPHPPLDC